MIALQMDLALLPQHQPHYLSQTDKKHRSSQARNTVFFRPKEAIFPSKISRSHQKQLVPI